MAPPVQIVQTRFLDALACKNSGRPPVWIMRQAGRYLPEYRRIRKKYTLMELFRTPEAAAEVTLMPIWRYHFDAAILFSDILVIAEAFGLGLSFDEGKGPVIARPVRDAADVAALSCADVREALGYVAAAARLAKAELNVPLIGFCGAPFTVASYLIEGGSSTKMQRTKSWMLTDPVVFHALLDKITNLSLDYLHLQIDAGVDAIQIFDSWANVLAYPQFMEFSCAYLRRMTEALRRRNIPVILFCKGASVFFDELARVGPACVGLDWNIDIAKARKALSHTVAVQGNLDPDILYAPLPVITREVTQLLANMRGEQGYVFNLGHGIHPDTPLEAVQTVVDTVKHFV